MGITARTRMARFMRTAPTGDAPGTAGGGAPATQPATVPAQGAPAGQPAGGAPPAGQPAGQPAPATGDQLGEAGLRALHAERDARKEAERKLAELETKHRAVTDQRPADQKLTDQVAELTRNLETERTERLRSQTALQHGIFPENAALLTGATPDELTAQATRIAALQTAATAAAGTPTTPGHQPHPGQGTPSSGEPPKKTLKDGGDAYAKFKATKAVQLPTPST
jgi:hypothetical protein